MKTKNIKYYRIEQTDLSSRASARALRCVVEQAISEGCIVTIDLTNTITVAESYADELIAVMIKQHGLQWFSDHVKLMHDKPSSADVFRSIATAVNRRMGDHPLSVKH